MPVTIIVDDRERGCRVPSLLEELGATVKYMRLTLADYVVAENVGVERKTVNDFINSIIDKRLFEQVKGMLNAFEKTILIVEGELGRGLRYRMVGRRQVFGALSAVALMGASTIFTENEEDTAYVIYSLARRLQEGGRRKAYVSPSKLRHAKGGKTLREAQVNLIASIPGISYDLAEKILRHFGSPRRFFAAHSHELKKVEGLGEKRAKKIIEILDTSFGGLETGLE